MGTFQVVSKKELLTEVREAVEASIAKKVKSIAFVAGITRAKDYNGEAQMMLEIVHLKQKGTSDRVNLLAAFNAGDNRFQNDLRTLRTWIKVTKQGFKDVLPEVDEKVDIDEVHKAVSKLKDDQVVSVFQRIKHFTIGEEKVKVNLVARQYSDRSEPGFPKNISHILDKDSEDRTEEEELILSSASMKTKLKDSDELVNLVDNLGRQVYEEIAMGAPDEEDKIIEKMPETLFRKPTKQAAGTMSNNVKDLIGSLGEED